ncbi:hypothetical protein KY285_020485 [Solanum tuberosum]|nr:hypothetical protein KY285_020485 [Solanum tuberosum]
MLGLNRLERFPEAHGSTPNGTPKQRKKSVVNKKRKEKKKNRNISLQVEHRNLNHLEMERGYHPQLEETEVGVGKLQRKHPQRQSERNEEGKPEEQIKKPYFIELNSPSSSRAATDHSERHVLHSTAQEAHERFAVADTNSGTGILDSCLKKNLNFKSFGEHRERKSIWAGSFMLMV